MSQADKFFIFKYLATAEIPPPLPQPTSKTFLFVVSILLNRFK